MKTKRFEVHWRHYDNGETCGPDDAFEEVETTEDPEAAADIEKWLKEK